MNDDKNEIGLNNDIDEKELEKFNEVFEKLSAEANVEIKSKLNSLDAFDEDIDVQIDQLIEQDEQSGKLEEIKLDYIDNVSVYDNGIEGQDEAIDETSENKESKKDKKRNKKNGDNKKFAWLKKLGDNKKEIVDIDKLNNEHIKKALSKANAYSLKVLYISIGVLVLVVVMSTVVMAKNFNNISKRKAKPKNGYDEIKQAEKNNYNTSFNYINQTETMDNEAITLSKFAADSLSTIFYFDKHIDSNRYIFRLKDDVDNVYSFDKNYFLGEDSKTLGIRFSPLKEGTKSFSLMIVSKNTNESVEFKFSFDNGLEYADARYLKKPVNVHDDTIDTNIKLYNIELSSSGTRVFFGFGKNKDGENIRIVDNNDKEQIVLEFGGSKIIPAKSSAEIIQFVDGQSLGIMDFKPVRSLNGKINVWFNNVFKEVGINKTISAAKLFLNTAENEITMPVGGFNVVLERMKIQGDKCVLVLHAEHMLADENITNENESNEKDNTKTNMKTNTNSNIDTNNNTNISTNSEPERIEINLDVELEINTANGGIIKIPGVSRSIKQGSDIIFDIKDVKEQVLKASQDNFSLNIKSAMFRLEDSKIELDLDKLNAQMPKDTSEILENIKKPFLSRLEYKEGKINKDDIEGFSNNVINNFESIGDYMPIDGINKSSASIDFLGYSLYGTQLHAVIAETWIGVTDTREINFSRTHKIIAYLTGKGWIISYDEII